MTDTVVAEGQVKFRDGKKWKTRWVVLRKPSPVADCLSLLVYKEKKKWKEKGGGHKERLNVTLEGICGVEPGPGYDGVSYTLSILCLLHTLVLGFSSRDAMLAWDARIRYSLGEVHRFSVNVEPGTKLESGSASLHLCNNLLVLSRGVPPLVVGHWKLSALRRYGAVPNGFVFEGGTRCGFWAGVFFLSCSDGEQISFLFDCVVRGVTPSRAPHGLRPKLPAADPSAEASSAEERISQETSDLEKRLSMLSHCSLASSTASTYSYSTSVATDDHSSISSSSSSQSDASYGSRPMTFWIEPLARSQPSGETASSSSTLKTLTGSDDRLFAAVMAGSASRPASAQPHSRGLHDSGRQSSLDSGIGIGQSSYSGSSSSCTGSLDASSHGGGEEFGSAASLPVAPTLPSSPPLPPPPPPQQPTPHPENVSSRVSSSCSSRSDSRAARRHSDEYHIPSLLRLWYDTPRSLLQADRLAQKTPPVQGGEAAGDLTSGLRAQRQAAMQRSHSWGSERAPSADSAESSTPTPPLLPGAFPAAETQCSLGADNYITPAQWRSARGRCLFQADDFSTLSASADTQAPFLCVRAPCSDGGVVGCKQDCLKRSAASLPPSDPPPPPPRPVTPSALGPTSACGFFRSPHQASAPPDAANGGHATVNYVNVHFSPLQAKRADLMYMDVNLREPSSRSAAGAVTDERSIGFGRLDTPARVGAELVQGGASGGGHRSDSATPSFHSLHLQ